jgi:putative sterol carrier protein
MATAFSDEWARAWCAVLNESPMYRDVAATWEGSVLLIVQGRTDAVFLDLHHGSCRGARVANDQDREQAAFAFDAEPATWRELLSGGGSPVMALMTGRLALTRGDLSHLLPYARAARELLGLAKEVDTVFPVDW